MAITVTSACGKQFRLKDETAGKRVKCPDCGEVLAIPASPVPQDNRANPPIRLTALSSAFWEEEAEDAPYQVQARPEDVYVPSPTVAAGNGLAMTGKRVAKEKKSGGAFGPERAGIDNGVLGGLGMMALAAVWFVVGLYFDRIFFYPPILFIIGLFAFFKGLVTGNIRGRASA